MFEELEIECPELAIVEYHSLDDYSNVYSEARIAYYDVIAFPHSRFDGTHQPEWNNYDAYVSAYEDRMAVISSYSLSIEIAGDGTDFNGSVTVGWLNANNENKVLHLVLTESHIPESWYGGEELHYVTRLMIPDQYGVAVLEGKDPDALFDFTFSLEPSWIKDYCELVVFVQDTVTMEVMQGNSVSLADVEISWYDVAVESIEYPVEEHCGESFSPVIQLKNLCHESLNNCTITYEVNGDVHIYNWEGDLETDSIALINLPQVELELIDNNTINIELSLPNGEEDQNPDNDFLQKDFQKAGIIEVSQLVLEIYTDDQGQETVWVLTNGSGAVIDEGGPYESNTLFTMEWELPDDDCYAFTILDSGGNGICCDNGNGYYSIKDSEGNVYFEGGEFGYEEQCLFQLDVATKIVEGQHDKRIHIFPNPAKNHITITSSSDIINLIVHNRLGQQVYHDADVHKTLTIDIREFNPGLYFLQVKTVDGVFTEKVIVK